MMFSAMTTKAGITTRLFLAGVLLASLTTLSAQEKPEQIAQKQAEHWLALIDAGHYDESWEQAAEIFKSAVTKESWKQQVSAVRGQTGKLKSRALKSAEYKESLPNAPAGKYVVIEFGSVFDVGPAVETVVPMQEKDGTWKVSGYFVKPAQ